MIKDKPWYPVVYMFCVTFFFSAIIIVLSAVTRDRVDANQRLAFEKAVLVALKIELPDDVSNIEMHDIYLEKIKEPTDSSGGAYIYHEGTEVKGYALPIAGQGFWDRIEAVIGIESDKQTMIAFSVYKQSETPGLGAEIAQLPFRRQFEGKKIAKIGVPFDIKPVTESADIHSVNAVTGATQTSVRLEKFMVEALKQWQQKML